MDVEHWLRGLGLSQYAAAFRDNAVDSAVLAELTADDLKELGVAAVGHRRRLLAAIAALRGEARDAEAGTMSPAQLATASGPLDAPSAERRQLTVWFCDLAGSTELSARLDPEDMRAVISAYHRGVTGVLQRQDGYVAKFLGDGVLAYFGWPEAHEDDAERAVRAGLQAVDIVAGLRGPVGPLAARVGIATGPVVVGDLLGEGAARERNVVGETPNLAARLQALTEPGTVAVDATTRQLTGRIFVWAELAEAVLKGLPSPVRAWRALAESGVESRFEALRSGAAAPMLGRGEELDLLLRRWRQARSGEGQVVLLRGEPGIGKSRLTAALQEALTGEAHEECVLYCSPQHIHSALRPLAVRLERAAGFASPDAPEMRLAKLEALLLPLGLPAEDMGLIADLLSVPTGGRWPELPVSPRQRREQLLAALLRWLEALAARRPLLVVVEDAHWVDPTTRELLEFLVSLAPEWPVLAVITYRPEFDPAAWLGQPHVTPVQLNRLGRTEHAALLRRIAGGKSLPAEVEAEILARTDGVPLFVEEVGRAVLESGPLREEGDSWVLDGQLPHCAVPPTLQAALVARLDRLGPAREVAQIGAVLGREFGFELLAAVARMPEARLREALAQLGDAGLLNARGTAPDTRYLFRHALIQEAAYGTMLRERRAELHGRTAAVIEARLPELAAAQPGLLARHYAQAGLPDSAAAKWELAGRRALAHAAQAEAAACFREAAGQLMLLPDTPGRRQRELRVLLPLATALYASTGDGSQPIERARELARESGDFGAYLEALYAVQTNFARSGRFREAVTVGEEALAIAKDARDPAVEGIASRIIGWPLVHLGRLGEAKRHLEAACRLLSAQALGRANAAVFMNNPLITARSALAFPTWASARPERALALAKQALTQADAGRNTNTRAFARTTLTIIHLLCRQPAEALEWSDALLRLAEEDAADYWRANADWTRGAALVLLGQPEEGLRTLQEGERRKHRSDSLQWEAWTQLFSAQAHLAVDDLAACEAEIAAAMDLAGSREHRFLEPELHRVAALAARRRGDRALAEAQCRHGIAVAQEQSARSWELRTACDLARLWRDGGHVSEAHDLLAPLHASFLEGFTFPDLAEARLLLGELGTVARIGRADRDPAATY